MALRKFRIKRGYFVDLKEIKKLIHIVEDAQISDFSIESNGTKIEIKKGNDQAPQASVVIPQQVAAPVPVAPQPQAPAAEQPAEEAPKKSDENLIAIKAQMVGTFYTSPNPESPAYVKEGDSIATGQVVCIIEAMKLFNEIEADCSGVVEKV